MSFKLNICMHSSEEMLYIQDLQHVKKLILSSYVLPAFMNTINKMVCLSDSAHCMINLYSWVIYISICTHAANIKEDNSSIINKHNL